MRVQKIKFNDFINGNYKQESVLTDGEIEFLYFIGGILVLITLPSMSQIGGPLGGM